MTSNLIWLALVLRIIDGDTFVAKITLWPTPPIEQTESIRILGIDTPEHGTLAGCDYERALADKAKARLAELVKPGTIVQISNIVKDKYSGRAVARVTTLDGKDVGNQLIAEGLARSYNGKTKSSWCSTTTTTLDNLLNSK